MRCSRFVAVPLLFVAACSSSQQTGDTTEDRLATASASSAKHLIMDHDGAFEAYFAVIAAALASKQGALHLEAVTTSPTGEAYCRNSNGFPDNDESSVVDATAKVLALANAADVPVVSGCDEAVAEVSVVDQDPASPTHGQKISFRVQEPLGGIGVCAHHREFNFQSWAPQCFNEFSTLWRSDTREIAPIAEPILSGPLNKSHAQPRPAESTKASEFIARRMCRSTRAERLTVLAVGPSTNVGRALQRIKASPKDFGCTTYAQLRDSVEVVVMGGAWDEHPARQFDASGKYKLDEREPKSTIGNIFYDPSTLLYAFGAPHVPDGVYPDRGGVDVNSGTFNALNNAEWNFFVDSVAVETILGTGVPFYIGALNATNHVPLKGFKDQIAAAIDGGRCPTMVGPFVRDTLRKLPAADDLQWWDSLITTSLYKNWVDYKPMANVKITTPKSGDPRTGGQEVWVRDAGKLYSESGGASVQLGMGIHGDEATFKDTFNAYMLSLLCDAR